MSASIEASSTVRRCFEGAFEESRLLESEFRRASDDRGCAFLDAGLFASGSDADGFTSIARLTLRLKRP
jgi:hypothetical protein